MRSQLNHDGCGPDLSVEIVVERSGTQIPSSELQQDRLPSNAPPFHRHCGATPPQKDFLKGEHGNVVLFHYRCNLSIGRSKPNFGTGCTSPLRWLANGKRVVVGYYRYHAVPGNTDRLRAFGQRRRRLWRLILSRRSQLGMLPWDRLKPIFDRWIPLPRVLHPYPDVRFAATYPKWEPYA